MELNEKDWKLFRQKLPEWQEAYMEKLIEEYKGILNNNNIASDKFWELDKRIKSDKKSTGVIVHNAKPFLILAKSRLGILQNETIPKPIPKL